ncbi:MAG TPA: HlyD family efflux transporter periplasmic adaptor subunit [Oscillospiraceae bacterium]|nr:HlyD family efflux transporter periplasmic adaptor subunit [Oscillospiraceae bacterium]
MRSGTFATKIIMFLLLLGVLIYMGVYIASSLLDPLQTALVLRYSADESVTAGGVLVRSEQVLEGGESTLMDILCAEGERVRASQSVAVVYGDEEALENADALSEAESRLSQLRTLAAESHSTSDVLLLDGEIEDAVYTLNAAVDAGHLSTLSDLGEKLKTLVFRRAYTYENSDSLSESITALEAQVETLRGTVQKSTQEITAPCAGTFSGLVDGFESILTPDILDGFTPSSLDALLAEQPAGGGSFGKLILGGTWYYACSLPEETAARLKDRTSVRLRFTRDYTEEITMHVDRVGEAEDGRCAVVLSCDRYLEQITLLRRIPADLIFSTTTGLRVPTAAVRVQEGVTGVYCVSGLRAVFKPVTILGQAENYYIAAIDAANSRALKAGDEVIVAAGELYDGKVVR